MVSMGYGGAVQDMLRCGDRRGEAGHYTGVSSGCWSALVQNKRRTNVLTVSTAVGFSEYIFIILIVGGLKQQ